MVEVSRIARENGSRSFLMGSKFTNVVLHNLFRVKKYSTCGIVRNLQQTIIHVFPYQGTVLLTGS